MHQEESVWWAKGAHCLAKKMESVNVYEVIVFGHLFDVNEKCEAWKIDAQALTQ